MLNSVGKLAGLEVAQSFPDLWPLYPKGMTISVLQKETGLPYHTVYAAVIWITENGKAKWIQRPDRKAAVLVPPDWEEPTWELTDKQSRLLAAIVAAADDEGLSHISYKQISEDSGTVPGSITAHIDALDRKGYLEIVTIGNSTTKSCFRAYPAGDGPKGYSPRRMRIERERLGLV